MQLLKAIGIRMVVYPIVIVGGVLIVIFAAALITRVPSAPHDSPRRIYVRIQGDTHVEFVGSITSIKEGQVTSKTVSGFTPTTFDTTADSVSVAIQKKSPGKGVLDITVEKDNKILNESSTTADFGMVTLTAK